MLQYPGSGAAEGFQTGALRVTAATGSAISSTGIEVPSLCAVQSASVSFLAPVCAHNSSEAAQNTNISRRFMVPLTSLSEVAIEEFYDNVVTVTRLRHIAIIEESVKQRYPDVQLGVDSQLHQLSVGIKSTAHLE